MTCNCNTNTNTKQCGVQTSTKVDAMSDEPDGSITWFSMRDTMSTDQHTYPPTQLLQCSQKVDWFEPLRSVKCAAFHHFMDKTSNIKMGIEVYVVGCLLIFTPNCSGVDLAVLYIGVIPSRIDEDRDRRRRPKMERRGSGSL